MINWYAQVTPKWLEWYIQECNIANELTNQLLAFISYAMLTKSVHEAVTHPGLPKLPMKQDIGQMAPVI